MAHKEKSKDPGLGTNYQKGVKRSMNEDGSYNIKRIGGISGVRDIYKFMVDMPSWKFILLFLTLFFLTNLLFATGYYLIGLDQLRGISEQQNPFVAAFYFSAQTFTTVGYGAISPQGNGASLLAAFEAFIGLIAFSVVTGLIYGRFSKPRAKIGFTHNVIYTKHEDGMAVMFKLVNLRDNVLLNAKIEVISSMKIESTDHRTFSRDYNKLELDIDSVRFFPLTWTIVHRINENSPFKNMSYEQILDSEVELVILFEAHDETFARDVIQKHSYAINQWIRDRKFKRNFHADEDGTLHLNIRELHDLEQLS
jgi:inward rectifier potassium channel